MKNYYALLPLIFIVLLLFLSVDSCTSPISNDEYYRNRIRDLARPLMFNYASWEVNTLCGMEKNTSGFTYEIENYSDNLKNRIISTLENKGITVFPPLKFRIEDPPDLLVVSPRDKIAYFDRIVLRQNLSLIQKEELETKVDSLGFSSLVVELGGFGGTYPPIVGRNSDIKFTIETIIEEWIHQYLAFKPLGFLYLLDAIGIPQDPDIVTMNETLAGIVSKELGSEIYNMYYLKDELGNQVNEEFNNSKSFDFEAEMRLTRLEVDKYLARGDIAGAESYMKMRREIFVANGYNIRKLNQAYFAFHGIYAYDPASVSPIYIDLMKLRNQFTTMKIFLDKVSFMTSYNDLKQALQCTRND